MSRESQYTHFEDKIQDQISIVSTVSTVQLAHFWVNFQFFIKNGARVRLAISAQYCVHIARILKKNIAQA